MPFTDKLLRTVCYSLALGGIAYITHGEPPESGMVYIDEREVIGEGFDATFDERAGAAVRVFLKIGIGAVVGVWIAERMRMLLKSSPPNAQRTD